MSKRIVMSALKVTILDGYGNPTDIKISWYKDDFNISFFIDQNVDNDLCLVLQSSFNLVSLIKNCENN